MRDARYGMRAGGRRAGRLVAVFAAAVTLICPIAVAEGQGVDTLRVAEPAGLGGYSWTGRLGVGRDAFRTDDPGWTAWTQVEGSIGRRFERGSLAVSMARVERFGEDAIVAGFDAYRALGPRRYGNLRLLLSPEPTVVPRADVAAELYQGIERGWEPSVGYRFMDYRDADVHVASLGLGRFVGDEWYGRVRGSHAWGAGNGGPSGAAMVRRYLGSPQEFVEVGGGVGVEAVTLPTAGAPIVETRRSWGVTASAQRFVGARTGVTATLGYHGFHGVPDRMVVGAGAMMRW